VGAVDLFLISPSNLAHPLEATIPSVIPEQRFEQLRRSYGEETFPVVQKNAGVVNCYEYVPWPTPVAAAGDPGYRGEQYLLDRGKVDLIRWSPNALTFQVETPTPTILVVNQNYDRSWKLIEGKGSVIDEGGLIGIRLPTGTERVAIAYRDWSVWLGALISLAASALAILIARRELTRG
jgi:hypothetical protein